MKDFPYPREHHGQWFWESGFDKDPINDAEAIRDWNLRAVYGAFNAMKNRDGAAEHHKADARLGGLHRRTARIAAPAGRRDPDARGHRQQTRFPGRLRAQHLVHRPALPEEGVRGKVPGQPVHLGGQVRRPRGPRLRLSRSLPLLLLAEHPQPVHGRPLHQRDARGAGHRAGDEDLRHDGRSGGQGRLDLRPAGLHAAGRVRKAPRRTRRSCWTCRAKRAAPPSRPRSSSRRTCRRVPPPSGRRPAWTPRRCPAW